MRDGERGRSTSIPPRSTATATPATGPARAVRRRARRRRPARHRRTRATTSRRWPNISKRRSARPRPIAQTEFIARHMIGLLDEAGYLAVPLREVAGDLGVPLAEVEEALDVVQSLDPTGVGARTLSECLALQASEADRYDPCMAAADRQSRTGRQAASSRGSSGCATSTTRTSPTCWPNCAATIPSPACSSAAAASEPVVPDILIAPRKDGGWDIALNEATLPRLVVNRAYYVELRSGLHRQGCQGLAEREAGRRQLADQGARPAAEDDPQGRRRDREAAGRLLPQAACRELRPLTLRDGGRRDRDARKHRQPGDQQQVPALRARHVRAEVFLHQRRRVGRRRRRDRAEAVKAQIRALCDAEDPKDILSDDKLVADCSRRGFDLARRTVAKYREAIGIGWHRAAGEAAASEEACRACVLACFLAPAILRQTVA